MKALRLVTLFLFAGGCWLGSVSAGAVLPIPPVPDHYVNDEAGLLGSAGREALEAKLAQFERDTSNQILVATFPDLQGESIEDFSIRLAEKWKPGQSGRDNGAILVVSKGDRKVRIEVGYGLEGVVPDAVSKAILQREILPAFKQANFEAGIVAGVDAILKATAGEYKGLPQGSDWPWGFLILSFILLLIFLFAILSRIQSYGLHRSGAYHYGGWGSGGSWGGSGSSWSGGSSGSSGGFSSGGGSFGGGGASGSW